MVIDFLREYQEELFAERIELKEQLDLIETRLVEDYKFVDVLMSSDKDYFSEFSPRDLNAKNREKAEEVKENIVVSEEQKKIVEDKIRKVDTRLAQIKSYIDEEIEIRRTASATNSIMKDSVPESIVARITNDSNELDDADSYDEEDIESDFVMEYKLDTETIINRLNSIKSYISVDPNRAKLDIDSLIKILNS